MKTILLLLIFSSFYLTNNAQIYTPTGSIQGSSGSDYVGIGTNAPSNKLTVSGNHYDARILLHSIGGGINERQADLILWASEPGWTYEGVGIGNNVLNSYYNGNAINRINTARGGSYIRLLNNSMLFHLVSSSGEDKEIINLSNNGNVGIGTLNPTYKLDVLGTIRSREVKVDMNGADFVFEKDYKLMPLSDLEKYLQKEKHLPEIATAKEMEFNGVELSKLNSKLLQKVEELTLYLIEQNKFINDLKEIVTFQNQKILKLEAKTRL